MPALRATNDFLVRVLLAALVATAIVLLIAPEALSQTPNSDQPAAKNFLSARQQADARRRVPITRSQKEATIPATNSLAPSFSTGVYSSGGYQATSVAVGDLNGDGWPDLAVVNRCLRFFMTCAMDGGSVSVLMGYGGGGFSGPTPYITGGANTYGVAIADGDNDGKLDVLVTDACYFPGYCFPVGVLLGNGDGSLQPMQQYYSNWIWNIPGGSVVIDVNGDGIPDLITLGNSTVNVQLGNDDGTFQTAISFDSGGTYAASIAVADVNRDGKPDFLVANACANDDACLHSYSGTVGVLINAAAYTATKTTMVASRNPTTVGQAVTFTATVAAYAGTVPDGDLVTFKNGDTVLGTAPLSAGVASLTTTALPVGVLNIAANYVFDGIYGASTAQLPHQVITTRGYPTSLALTASPNPSYPGQTVTFTAQVISSNGSIPDGELLAFYSGTTMMGTGVTAGGVATFVTSSLTPKAYAIKAIYSGDATFKTSSGTVTQQAYGNPTGTSLSNSLNPSIYGQAVTFQAVVYSMSPPFSTPTGKVKFMWDRFTIGSATLSSNLSGMSVATLTTSMLNAGTYPLMAVYSGDSMNAPSTSQLVSQVVLPTTTSATLTSSSNPSSQGQAVTFTATITSPTVVAKGPVIFTIGKTVLGTAQLGGGKAKLTTSSMPAGTALVTVTYQGNSNIAGSTASVTQIVQ
jgi:hypothetical protein